MNFEADIIKTYGSSDTMSIIVQLFDENEQLMAKFAFDTPSLELNVERHMKVTNISTSKITYLQPDTEIVVAKIYSVSN